MSNRKLVNLEEAAPLVALQMTEPNAKPRLIIVDRDGFTIGSGNQCDLQLADGGLPRLHSILHVQGSAVWIEAADRDALLTVGDEVFRRRALRDGDQLRFNDVEIVMHIGEKSVRSAQPVPRPHFAIDQLARLSADELCDLIDLEETQVRDFERGRRRGLQALLSAVQQTRAPIITRIDPPATSPAAPMSEDKFSELVTHVRGLSESLEERAKELAAQEALLIESSSQLAEAQQRVSRQLDQLLERLANEDDHPGELRVSA
jgi:hypothetical protein